MAALATPTSTPASTGAAELRLTPAAPAKTPIVAAVDDSSASRAVVETTVRLAAELKSRSCSCTCGEGRPASSEGRSSSAA
jgi:hypothetical protein